MIFSVSNFLPLLYLFGLLFIGYIALLTVFLNSWNRLHKKDVISAVFHHLSVIVPVRNEAKNILLLLKDIVGQEYPKELFEVIVINDQSTDQTEALVSDFSRAHANISIINIGDIEGTLSHKKRAIEIGINAAKGEIIITTDGDCRVGREWLNAINENFGLDYIQCVCGPVTYLGHTSFFNKIQTIEFAALLGSGAATINLNLPGMCNGANLSYRKKAFKEVKGFDNIDKVASGDDELLMHKILRKFPNGVTFLKDQKAIVETESNSSFKQLFNQRKRWASKWSYYKSPAVKLLAIFIFLFNLYLAVGWTMIFLGWISWQVFVGQYLIKMIFEALFISQVLKFLKKKIHLFHFVVLQIVYPFYTTFFGIVANFGGYEWKERRVK